MLPSSESALGSAVLSSVQGQLWSHLQDELEVLLCSCLLRVSFAPVRSESAVLPSVEGQLQSRLFQSVQDQF